MIVSLEKTNLTSIPTMTDLYQPTLSLFNKEYYLLKITYHKGQVENKIFNTIVEREKEYNKLKREMR